MKLSDFENDIVIFDMDGVLNRYDFGDLGFKLKDVPEWVVANLEMNVYDFAVKTNIFDELISSKNSMDLYILSTTLSSFEQKNKIAFLENNYPNFREDNIIFVGNTDYKIYVLKYLRELYDSAGKQDKRIIMIEDSVKVMCDVEKLHSNRIKCYLVSDFI